MDIKHFYQELDVIFRQGDIHRAEHFMRDQLEEARTRRDIPAILAVCNELGGVYRVLNRFDEGRAMYALALEAIRLLELENTLQHGTTLMNLASLHTEERNREEALKVYKQVEDIYRQQGLGADYRMAALCNNISHAYDLLAEPEKALAYAEKSLAIILALPDHPVETATTYTTLAMRQMKTGGYGKAEENLKKAESIFLSQPGARDVHYASTLNALGELSYHRGKNQEAIGRFQQAMALLKEHYGENQAYDEVRRNLEKAQKALNMSGNRADADDTGCPLPSPGSVAGVGIGGSVASAASAASGMEMARELYINHGRAMIRDHFSEYEKYMAVGLVGEGSECFGFDDAISRDHDFRAGFCIWLPERIYVEIGDSLREAYARLEASAPAGDSRMTGEGAGRRGVFSTGDFYRRYVGTPGIPKDAMEWLLASETGLATVVNGQVFVDPYGEFSGIRKRLLEFYPKDVFLKKLTARLAAMSQSGQYNYQRSMKRGDIGAAHLSGAEFIRAAAGAFYLLRKTYIPFYKWIFRGMEGLEGGGEMKERLLRLARMADIPSNADEKAQQMEEICIAVRLELNRAGLSDSRENFLVAHSEALMSRIGDPGIRRLPLLFDGRSQ